MHSVRYFVFDYEEDRKQIESSVSSSMWYELDHRENESSMESFSLDIEFLDKCFETEDKADEWIRENDYSYRQVAVSFYTDRQVCPNYKGIQSKINELKDRIAKSKAEQKKIVVSNDMTTAQRKLKCLTKSRIY